ncbi:MAG: adenosylhomocysteinase [Bacteroidales bacterium]|nr:adenosylhomocysteinase [Bacteroidales bacterium]
MRASQIQITVCKNKTDEVEHYFFVMSNLFTNQVLVQIDLWKKIIIR